LVLSWYCFGYIVVHLPFLVIYLCSAYFLYLEYYTIRTKNPTKDVAASSKEKEAKKPQALVKIPTPEVKEILKPPSSFSFENEI
jgi:hypothetical protein